MTEHAVRPAGRRHRSRAREQGPSPREGERLRPLTRWQIADHLEELGELYAANSGAEPWAREGMSRAFLGRLGSDMRHPGFALLVAENPTVTACAFGFPLSARLFAIREIVVGPAARERYPDRDWNLARRLQRRLLGDHDGATGITVVARSDVWTQNALRSWGWRDAATGPHGAPPFSSCRVLLLDP